jgi:hypothetical protein
MAISINQILSIAWKGLAICFVLAVIGWFATKWIKRKRYNYDAEIYELDNLGNLSPRYEKFGINVDKKTNKEMGWLQGSKEVIGLDKFSYQLIQGQKKTIRMVRLLRIGTGNYVFLKPRIVNDCGHEISHMDLAVTREDTDWAINAYIRWTKVLQARDKMREILSFALIGTAVAVVFVVLILLIKNIPDITEAMVNTANAMRATASMLKDAAVAGGGVING